MGENTRQKTREIPSVIFLCVFFERPKGKKTRFPKVSPTEFSPEKVELLIAPLWTPANYHHAGRSPMTLATLAEYNFFRGLDPKSLGITPWTWVEHDAIGPCMEYLRTVILMVNEGEYTTHGAYMGWYWNLHSFFFHPLYATMQSLWKRILSKGPTATKMADILWQHHWNFESRGKNAGV